MLLLMALVLMPLTLVTAQDSVWPALPTSGFISGRAATATDVAAGNAVFVAKVDGTVIGKPLEIVVPQYALLSVDGEETPIPVVIVQAEHAVGMDLIGYRRVDGSEGVATLPEFVLLGRTTSD